MKLSFSRGHVIKAADAQASAALSFVWEQQVPSVAGSSLALRRIDDQTYLFEHEVFGSIYLSKRPWWSELPSPVGEQGLWLSYQGFSDGVWCDGVFGRWVDGRWVDLILPGASFTWELSRSSLAIDDAQEVWEQGKYFAWKQSLVIALRTFYSTNTLVDFTIQRGESSIDLLMNMLLLRLAFPTSLISILPENVGWKRLAQNLNIVPLREPSTKPLMECLALGPHEKILDILHWQQSKSPFIPLNLLSSL